MLMEGHIVKLMVRVDPELYGPYVFVNHRGVKCLYVRLLKALYGLLCSALLFYKKLCGELEKYGFEINPYDPCVANATIAGT